MNSVVNPKFIDDFRAPLERLTGLPNVAFNSAEFAEFERDHILTKTWFCVANEAQLPRDGWVHPVDILDLPLLVVRDQQANIRVFHNVCSHRGMKLVEESKAIRGVISCRYHGWCYRAADGQLSGTPHIKGEGVHEDPDFDKSLHGLKEVRTHIFAGMIFVNISGDAEDFTDFIKPVTQRWHEFDFNQWTHGGEDSFWEITLNGNWKFAQENHVDGYHLPCVHPSLNSYSPLRNHYPLVIEGCAAGQGTKEQAHAGAIGAGSLPVGSGLSAPWLKGQSEFLSVFPNIMMGVHSDHVWVVQLVPLAADKTLERMDLYYFADGATDDKYAELRRNNRDRMLDIFEEDRDMVEGMQRGRNSPVFDGGAFAPAMDQPAHCFSRIIAQAVLDAGGGE